MERIIGNPRYGGRRLRKQRATLVGNEVNLSVRPLRENDIPSIIAIDEQTSGRAKPEHWHAKQHWHAKLIS